MAGPKKRPVRSARPGNPSPLRFPQSRASHRVQIAYSEYPVQRLRESLLRAGIPEGEHTRAALSTLYTRSTGALVPPNSTTSHIAQLVLVLARKGQLKR